MNSENKEMKMLKELLRDTVYGREFDILAFMSNNTCEALVHLREWIEELQAENVRLKGTKMTPDQINQLHQLLQTALCPNVTNGCQDGIMPNPYGEMEQCQWCEMRKQALALLPCETCNDTETKKWICCACSDAESCDIYCTVEVEVGEPECCPISGEEAEWNLCPDCQ